MTRRITDESNTVCTIYLVLTALFYGTLGATLAADRRSGFALVVAICIFLGTGFLLAFILKLVNAALHAPEED